MNKHLVKEDDEWGHEKMFIISHYENADWNHSELPLTTMP